MIQNPHPIPVAICGNKDRKSKLVSEFRRVGIDEYSIQTAVYCETPSKGIFLAHQKAIELSRHLNKSDYHIIIEDDCEFTHSDSFRYFLQTMNDLPKDWDLFLGGFSYIQDARKESESIISTTSFSATHFYAMGERYVDEFLSLQVPSNIDIDVFLSSPLKTKPNIFACYPIMAIQSNGYSENTKKIENYDRYFAAYKKFYGYDSNGGIRFAH